MTSNRVTVCTNYLMQVGALSEDEPVAARRGGAQEALDQRAGAVREDELVGVHVLARRRAQRRARALQLAAQLVQRRAQRLAQLRVRRAQRGAPRARGQHETGQALA